VSPLVRSAAASDFEAISALLDSIGVLRPLGSFGASEEHLAPIAAFAARAGSNKVNPRPASAQDLEQILRETL